MINFSVRDTLGKGFVYESTGRYFEYFDQGYQTRFSDPVVYRYETGWVNDYGITTYVARSWMSQNLSQVLFLNDAGQTLISVSGTRNEFPIDRTNGETEYLNGVPSGRQYLFLFDNVNFTGTKFSDYVNLVDANDVIASGGSGNDTFITEFDKIILRGGTGNDSLISYGMETGSIMDGGLGNDTIRATSIDGASRINGGDGNDNLIIRNTNASEAYTVSILGGAGRDIIKLEDPSGYVRHFISGGDGIDMFVFNVEDYTGYSNRITITDFKRGTDTIKINLEYSDDAIEDFSGIKLTRANGNTVIMVDDDYKIFVQDELIYMSSISYDFI